MQDQSAERGQSPGSGVLGEGIASRVQSFNIPTSENVFSSTDRSCAMVFASTCCFCCCLG